MLNPGNNGKIFSFYRNIDKPFLEHHAHKISPLLPIQLFLFTVDRCAILFARSLMDRNSSYKLTLSLSYDAVV